jgi:hypothetical protein
MNSRELLPWVLGALAVIAAVGVYLWWTAPEENRLPEVYEVM